MTWPMAAVIMVALFFGAIVACNALWAKATNDLVEGSMTTALHTICYQEGWNAAAYNIRATPPDNSTECQAFFTFGQEDGEAGVFNPP